MIGFAYFMGIFKTQMDKSLEKPPRSQNGSLPEIVAKLIIFNEELAVLQLLRIFFFRARTLRDRSSPKVGTPRSALQ